MHTIKLRASVVAIMAALGLAACGGGSSNSTTTATSTGASSVVGVITGFGSVYVNGVEYETDSASVSVEGGAASEADLAVGMRVSLEGSVNADGTTGTATAISYADELEGVVSANTIPAGGVAGTLTIMGQSVIVAADTTFESDVVTITGPDQIVAGNIVEVSGYADGSGTIYATRIEVKKEALEAGDEIELKGVISAIDTTAMTFSIGSQSVDYSGAQLSDLPGGAPADGLYVEVKSTEGIVAGVLVASEVELEDDGEFGVQGDEGEELGLEGQVTDISGLPESFALNGQTVYLTADTEYEHGTQDDIVEGARLEVEGQFNADGQLVAAEIALREQGEIEMEAPVEAVDAAAGTLTVLGQSVSVTTLTTLMDSQDEGGQTPVRYFDLADLGTSDWVEIHAYTDDNGALVATRLERDDADTEVKLQGPVESVPAAGQVVIAGVTVDLSAIVGLDPQVGDKLEVAGSYSGGILSASEASLDE